MKSSVEDKEFINDMGDKIKDDEEKYIVERLNEIEDIEDEDEKTMTTNKIKLEYQAK